eukprot:GFYU01017491.1.p1 GENE.GFYU01017491.1~~GFYU01017491.1.p1  ORF type:complete len:322 (+),score=113.94 GFYU01017491.1:136-1101(+)
MLDCALTYIGGIAFLISAVTYLLPQLLVAYLAPQDLKKKYGASWAMVTGASSGIGLAVTKRLAKQGINVVMVAYPDKLLEDSHSSLTKEFPALKFVKIGANLASDTFMDQLVKDTKDLDIRVFFMNAGYIKTGFFNDLSLDQILANYNCNSTSVVRLTHHFIQKLYAADFGTGSRKAAFVFTSSPAGFMATPFSSMYGSTKAFLTEFVTSVAPEVREDGIDMTVVHPSPVTSNFYNGTHKLDALEFFRKTGTGPDLISEVMFSSVGRVVVRDQGYYSLGLRMILKVLDVSFMAEMITRFASMMGDYKKMRSDNQAAKAKAK